MNNTDIIGDILSPEQIRLNESVSSQKKVLELLSRLFASSCPDLLEHTIFEALSARERLGSTALERGIALPHCRIAGCNRPVAALLTLTEGVDFDARDGQPASIIWALIVPEEANQQHLNILASIASLLNEESACEIIRSARNSEQLHQQLQHMLCSR